MCRSVRVFILLVAFFSFISVSYASGDKALYYEGISYAKRGSLDFAFMLFDELTREFSSSAFFEDALFAKGEYYFSICDYNDAYSVFKKIAASKELSKRKLFSYVYLFKLSQMLNKDEDIRNQYIKSILTFRQITLLFRDSREITYSSPLQKKYRAVYFIDHVEVYIDGEKFFKASF